MYSGQQYEPGTRQGMDDNCAYSIPSAGNPQASECKECSLEESFGSEERPRSTQMPFGDAGDQRSTNIDFCCATAPCTGQYNFESCCCASLSHTTYTSMYEQGRDKVATGVCRDTTDILMSDELTLERLLKPQSKEAKVPRGSQKRQFEKMQVTEEPCIQRENKECALLKKHPRSNTASEEGCTEVKEAPKIVNGSNVSKDSSVDIRLEELARDEAAFVAHYHTHVSAVQCHTEKISAVVSMAEQKMELAIESHRRTTELEISILAAIPLAYIMETIADKAERCMKSK